MGYTLSAAAREGVIRGVSTQEGIAFLGENPITLQEAAAIMDRLLDVADVYLEDAASWSSQAMANMESVQVVSAGSFDQTGQPVTMVQAAEILTAAMELLESYGMTVSGIGAYAISAVANVLFKHISQPVVVDMENYHYEGEATIICVCSGRYYGGGFMPVGDNMPDDGLLETLVVRKVDRLTFFRLVGEYGRGRYARYPNLIQYGQGNGVTVRSPQELVAVVDGEPLRAHKLDIRLSDKKVNFFYPAGLDYRPGR